MNAIQEIRNEVRIKEWMGLIKSCKESGMPVNKWCKENNVNQATYYKYLKKIREGILETNNVKNETTFIPVKFETEQTDKLIISKGSIKIEILPNSDVETVINIMRSLLC